jgi:hypothetical protein
MAFVWCNGEGRRVSLGRETSDVLSSYMLEFLKKLSLMNRVIGISASYTNTNFGGKKRKGKNNLYHKLQGKTANNLISVGFSFHILPSTVQIASNCIRTDIESQEKYTSIFTFMLYMLKL